MAQKKIAAVVAEIFEANVTGILTFSMNNDTSLFKVFFRSGRVYHITHSTCKDRECLTGIGPLPFKVGMFMPGAQLDTQERAPLPEIPKQDVLAAFSRNSSTIEWAGTWTGRSSSQASSGTAASPAPEKDVFARVTEELLDLAGPVASMVLDTACRDCRINQGQALSSAELQRLIRTIAGQLPEEQGKEFMKRFAAG